MTDLPGVHDHGPIEHVREGMTVVDESGERVGSVEEVRMGDPEATTGAGQAAQGDEGFIQDIAAVFASSNDLSEQEQARLLRIGYVKVDHKGLLTGDDYIGADRIARVEGDTVHVRAPHAG